MTQELIVIKPDSIATVFSAGGMEQIVDAIRDLVGEPEFNIETEEGKKACASIAYQVARSKTYIDKIGKEYVSRIKAQAKIVDAERAYARTELDKLRDKIRAPLNTYEEAERQRVDSIKFDIAFIEKSGTDPYSSSSEIRQILKTIQDSEIDPERYVEFTAEAAKARENTILLLKAKLITFAAEEEAYKKDAEDAEKKRAAEKQEAAISQAEREKKIAQEAARQALTDKEDQDSLAQIAADEARRQREHDEAHIQDVLTDITDRLLDFGIAASIATDIAQALVDNEIPHAIVEL